MSQRRAKSLGAASTPASSDEDSLDDVPLAQLKLVASAQLRLDADSDRSEHSECSEADEEERATAKRAAAKRRRKARKANVSDIRGRKIRGLLTSLGTLMFLGDNNLCALDDMHASLIVKPGNMRKHCIERWHHGFGTGPSYAKCAQVFDRVGAEHLDPVIAYNDEREKLPVSHANLRATWLGATRPRAPSLSLSASSQAASQNASEDEAEVRATSSRVQEGTCESCNCCYIIYFYMYFSMCMCVCDLGGLFAAASAAAGPSSAAPAKKVVKPRRRPPRKSPKKRRQMKARASEQKTQAMSDLHAQSQNSDASEAQALDDVPPEDALATEEREAMQMAVVDGVTTPEERLEDELVRLKATFEKLEEVCDGDFTFIGDNIDFLVKIIGSTKSKRNKMYHWFHIIGPRTLFVL